MQGNYAYIITGSGNFAYFQILNVNYPSNPVMVGNLSITGARKVFISGHYAFIASGSLGVSIVDVSNPAVPRLRGSINTPGEAVNIFANSHYLYVADGIGGLTIVDISNPSNPVLRGRYTNVNVSGVWVKNSVAATTGANNLLTAIDVIDPLNPSELGRLRPQGETGKWVKVSGNYAFVADENKLRVIKLKN